MPVPIAMRLVWAAMVPSSVSGSNDIGTAGSHTASRPARSAAITVLTVEAASGFGWQRWVGDQGAVISMHGFGASAPYQELMRKFGFTVDAVVEAARRQLTLATT